MTRAIGLLAGAFLTAVMAWSASTQAMAQEKRPAISVWKSATCGCCVKWVEHLRQSGYQVIARDVDDLDEIKRVNGVPTRLQSCHTAKVGAYVVEGHVPASDIDRLLKERPAIKGIAVPGMPLGSPGMEVPSGEKESYVVLSFDEAGRSAPFSQH